MNRNEMVKTLLKEGFSDKTLVGFSDKQLSDLHVRLFSEQIMTVTKPSFKIGEKGGNLPPSDKGYQMSFDPLDKKPVAKALEEKKLKKEKDLDESLFGISIAAAMDRAEKKYGRKPTKREVEREFEKMFPQDKEEKKSEKETDKKETKEWLETIAENNFHSYTSKNEIMELIKTKLNEVEVGPNVKKGHNGVPEFMSYDAIANTEVKESSPTTKPAPTKPKVDPGTKPKTPWSPKPGEKSKPKALKEKKNADK